MVVRVGDKDRPATDEDIKDVIKLIKKAVKRSKKKHGKLIIVTHHACDFQIVKIPKN